MSTQGGKPDVEAVVFDIGRVLVDFEFDRAFHAASQHSGIPAPEIRQRLFGRSEFSGGDANLDVVAYECGRITSQEFHERVQNVLQCSLTYDVFHEMWNCIFKEEIAPTVAAMRGLKKRADLKVGILSNTNALHFDFLRARMSCLSEIEHVYCSHEIGFRKPDVQSYMHVLSKMNVRAERTVFVDDLAENIEAANALGMIGVFAPDAKAVQQGLSKLGLI